jgi:S-formylglutathione hydrolase FrmB
VDPDRTAITGISWGGYLTNIVAGLDDRFKAAVPVYGCGFLHQGSAWDGQFAAMTAEQRDKWVTLWDPSSYVGAAEMPIFFVNGTNDFAYWLESYAKTYGLVHSTRNYRITVRMPHGHEAGWAPREIGRFIDQYLIDGPPLPTLAVTETNGETMKASVAGETRLASAEIHHTSDDTPSPDREWQSAPAVLADDMIHAPAPPADAKIWFFTGTDTLGAVVSSPLVFVND